MKLSEMLPVEPKFGQMPMSGSEIEDLAVQIPGWTIQNKLISRQFKFKNFDEAMVFINQVADIARSMNHHPTLKNTYSTVVLELNTHKVDGLTINDFIFAARVNDLMP
jgi:4a-hydroxytetrahydrobiopterin dehydratase